MCFLPSDAVRQGPLRAADGCAHESRCPMRTMSMLAPVLAGFVAAGTASAQTDERGNVWRHGTTATAIAGVASDGSRSGPAIGGAIGWEVTRRFALEGDGAWMHLGDGMKGFAGSLKARVRMFGRRPIDPFVHAGAGFYRASFSGPARHSPRFYQHRMRSGVIPPGASTFTDPSLVAGGGINFHVRRQLALRPTVDAAFIMRDRRHYVVTTVALQAVFHFEDHPVTPTVPRVPPGSPE